MLLCSLPRDFDVTVEHEYAAVFDVVWQDPLIRVWPKPATAWLTAPGDVNVPITAEKLDRLPNLRILATASTGTNHIDLAACAARGIKVLSLLDDRDGLNTISASAEWTFKLILEGLRLKRPYHELQGRSVMLIGHGRIGRKVQEWCKAFGASVDWYDPPGGDFMMPLATRFSKDVTVICCALTDETRGMITWDLLRRLPPDAVLVNTARGEVIVEDDLCKLLVARPDVRMCLDVVDGEVDGKADYARQRLRQLGAYVSDHIAGETYESRTKAARIILGLLKKEMVTA